MIQYVQEVVTHIHSKLIYKMGHYFLDTQYHTPRKSNFHILTSHYIQMGKTSWTYGKKLLQGGNGEFRLKCFFPYRGKFREILIKQKLEGRKLLHRDREGANIYS